MWDIFIGLVLLGFVWYHFKVPVREAQAVSYEDVIYPEHRMSYTLMQVWIVYYGYVIGLVVTVMACYNIVTGVTSLL